MKIDAGSGRNHLNLFEWDPRVLRNPRKVATAVSGKKLAYPGMDSEDRLVSSWVPRMRCSLRDGGG